MIWIQRLNVSSQNLLMIQRRTAQQEQNPSVMAESLDQRSMMNRIVKKIRTSNSLEEVIKISQMS